MWKSASAIFGLVAALLVSDANCQTPRPQMNTTSVRNWKPPGDMYKDFPYYIPGFDLQGRPMVLWEFGKWNFRAMLSAGDESAKIMENYMSQTVQTLIELGTMFKEEGGLLLIFDMEGFGYLQFAHVPTTLLFAKTSSQYSSYIEPVLYQAYCINVAYAAQQAFGLLAPILGSTLAKAQLLGTVKERWLPALLAEISNSQLPTWYGGNKGWKPLQLLGKGVPLDEKWLRRERAKVFNDL